MNLIDALRINGKARLPAHGLGIYAYFDNKIENFVFEDGSPLWKEILFSNNWEPYDPPIQKKEDSPLGKIKTLISEIELQLKIVAAMIEPVYTSPYKMKDK